MYGRETPANRPAPALGLLWSRLFIVSLLRVAGGGLTAWVFLGGLLPAPAAAPPLSGLVVEQPRVNRGLVFAESTDAGVQHLARRLEELDASARGAAKGTPTSPPLETTGTESSATENDAAPAVLASGRLLAMPRMNPTQFRELLDSLRLKLAVGGGFRSIAPDLERQLPAVPEGIGSVTGFARTAAATTRVVRVGIYPFVSRSSELWVDALVRRPGGGWEADPELEAIESVAKDVLGVFQQPKPDLNRDDLEYRLIQISYIDGDGAIEGLKGFGIETAESPSKVVMPVPFAKLPVVARMPTPDPAEMALLGAEAQKNAASFDLSVTPSIATSLPPDPNLARASQLLVYYHPAHPEQFTRVRKLMDQYIDRPAQQIFIEGLVLEISEAGLKELGVEWQYKEGGAEISAGNLFAGLPALAAAGASYDSLRDLEQQWTVRLRTLIEDEKAEILSRPSVLTLNNRQATIRVGQEIPIATSSEAGIVKDANRISFNFKYLATGISLNIRPRISEDANEVSMLVDTVVSSAIPGADLELRSSSGETLASAPTIATRRVQTYTRIGNNTPFIIGGLVNKEFTQVKRKVPLLGDIPYLGTLFRSRSTKSRKQEVIIVLTPHVLPEAVNERAWGRYLPRDDDKFDEVGNTLFRAAYRIREEDVLDLSFLDRSEQLGRYRTLARRAIDADFKLAERPPFSYFAEGRVPGEHILVERMIYEVLKRLSDTNATWMSRRVAAERLIFFSGRNAGGYDVQFLQQAMADLGDGTRPESFFESNPGKALAIVFRPKPENLPGSGLGLNQSPIPELSLVPCPDRKTWGELLWTLNRPDADGTPRAAILIRDPEDMMRLQRSVLLREVINLNGGPNRVNRRTFNLGQVLLVPDENPLETRLIDIRTAAYFAHTEHYYAATLERIQEAMAEVDRALAQPEFQHLK